MPQLSLSCPHCDTERIGFTPIGGAVQVKPDRQLALLFLQCQGCGHGVIAEVLDPGTAQRWVQGQTSSPGNIVQMYPKAVQPQSPADVPDNVRLAFLSGLDNLGRENGANAAAIMFRRSVELGAKKLNPNGKGDLKQRIEQLPSDLATPAMKKWAHHVRLEANDAAHDLEEFTKEDAEKLHKFAEMFLTYAFTLPETLRKAGGTVEEPKS